MHILVYLLLIVLSFVFIYKSRKHLEVVKKAKQDAESLVKQRTLELHKFSQATKFSPVSISITDKNGKIEYINPKCSEQIGYSLEEIKGKTFNIIRSNKNEDFIYVDMWRTILSKKEWEGELLNRTKNGKEFWESIKISPIIDEDGEITHYVAIKEDITFKKLEEEKMRYQANFDSLTNIPNRKYFNELLEELLEKAKEKSKNIALLYIDLDGFKPINDTLGHSYGDILLQELAVRLKNSIRSSDIVARLGGDEFVIILNSGVNLSGVKKVADNILKIVSEPFYLKDNLASYVTASIGISFSNSYSHLEFIKKADIAMYEAKHIGKNRYIVYEELPVFT